MKKIIVSLLLMLFSSLVFADLPPPAIGATCKARSHLGATVTYCWKANKHMGIRVQQISKHGLLVWKNDASHTTGGQYKSIYLQLAKGDRVGITATQLLKHETVEIKVVKIVFYNKK